MTQSELEKTIIPFLKKRLAAFDAKAFLFGSSLQKERFYDVDIGIVGDVPKRALSLLREDFEEGGFPYKVDVVSFNKVTEQFKDNVFREKMLWLEW